MDRATSFRPSERPPFDTRSPAPYPRQFAQSPAQPPMQLPYSDPFPTAKDPFLAHQRRGSSSSLYGRAWPSPQDVNHALPPPPPPPPPPPSSLLPTAHPLPPNGASMSLPFDPSRRRSIGPGSPSHFPQQQPLEPPPIPPSFQSRHMPPPSPGSAPRGPPIASLFSGARDLASFSSRPSGGMSISSILGNNDDRKTLSSPRSQMTNASTPNFIQPPSPGRARSTSMREGYNRGGFRDVSPPRSMFGQPRPASSAQGHERTASEQPRKAEVFGSPQFHRESEHTFRAYHPPQQEPQSRLNGNGAPMRPNSQPGEHGPMGSLEELMRRNVPPEGLANLRHFESQRNGTNPRHEPPSFVRGPGPTSQPVERSVFSSPPNDPDRRFENPLRFRPNAYGTPMREDQTNLFRPGPGSGPESAQESIEARHFQDLRSEMARASPPMSDMAPLERLNGFPDRPMTWEEHQRLEPRPMTWEEHRRMEAIQRELEQRKESDGSIHRTLMNLSPELNRKGRNSPLPQAVQGAQPRHVGPGGNSGVKMEFGRMFSGLGSGVGSATPTAGQSVNGTTTPSRLSPMRQVEGGDLVRTAVAEIEEGKGSSRGRGRGGGRKSNGRRSREEDEKPNGVGRETPDALRGNKRAKASHHHHHHAHHHHHHPNEPDIGPSPFSTLRFPSNPQPPSAPASNAAHHHHHHAHPGHHHHHHAPRPISAVRKPTSTVMSRQLVEECASKPRKHLGSQLYTTEIASVPVADTIADPHRKFSSKMKAIPVFAARENCTYTVRVPRRYLASSEDLPESSPFEEICRRRQLWGTDVYTDDTDVVAAAVHSGWIQGDFGDDLNKDLRQLCPEDSEDEGQGEGETPPTVLAVRPRRPVKVPPERDAHVTVLILPPLNGYASTMQHHVRSREWAHTHDGMSFMVHRIEFVDEGPASRFQARGAKARKQKMAAEEAKRREAADSLLMFANGGAAKGNGVVSVGA